MAQLTVRMPALSATMEDALLIEWLVAPGDEVRTGQAIAEVSTDKVDMELESPYDGTIDELLVDANTQVDLGAPIALVQSEEDDLLGGLDFGDGPAPTEAEPDGQDEAPAGDAGDGGDADAAGTAGEPGTRPPIMPAPPPVRATARRMGIDLHDVTPTGSRGQVTRADLAAYAERRDAGPEESLAATPPVADEPARAADAAPARGADDRSPAAPATGMEGRRLAVRRATARSTTVSAAVPQFTLFRRIDVTTLQGRRGSRSIMTELARALAAALWRHPALNAQWDDEQRVPVPLEDVRIGIAVANDHGLVVVGVDDPDAVEADVADERMRAAIARGRAGTVRPDDMQGVSSTISNLGGMGVDRFNALLVPPQATILSVGRVVETPVVVDGRVRPRPMMEVGLTVDHRVADGADGAAFLETFVTRLGG